MSEQGKISIRQLWNSQWEHDSHDHFDCIDDSEREVFTDEQLLKLHKRLTTAETTAADYAEQAAELQEQNEELHRKLNHNCQYCPGLQEENTVLIHRVADLEQALEKVRTK